MAGHPTPTASRRLMADEPRRIGGAARDWRWLSQFLADCWSSRAPHGAVQLWVEAQNAQHMGVAVRVRAATALESWFR
jgi:hypothetical protein